jgi:DNA-directed RNA polymerase subunit M/transcription elongation factor TFIIS
MNSKAKMCDNCNSQIITIKRNGRLVAECSYCGESSDAGFDIEDFPEYEEDE